MKKVLLLLALALGGATYAAEALPLFNATLTIGKEHRFVLVDAAGKTSGFLALGESFAGYKLKHYDAKTGALEVEKDGVTTKLTLVSDAAIANAPAVPTRATLADAEEVFRVMRFDDMMKKILDGQKKGMMPMIQQQMAQAMSRMGANLSDEDKAALREMQGKLLDQTFSAITSPEMRAEMAKIYSEVFSKEELNSMAGFYGTPAGQALVDKQPEVQQKMMSVMMPMIMKSQQSAQKEMSEFMMGLRAKYASPSASGSSAAPANVPAPAPAPTPAPKP
jgi:hypothetical protein